jgi:hypothetical protein
MSCKPSGKQQTMVHMDESAVLAKSRDAKIPKTEVLDIQPHLVFPVRDRRRSEVKKVVWNAGGGASSTCYYSSPAFGTRPNLRRRGQSPATFDGLLKEGRSDI